MILNNITKWLLAVITLTISIDAQDANILAYMDRGIKYYPRYVSKGLVKIGKASWYGKQFHKRLTASGERYNMYSMTAAHRTYALNTILKVTNLENHKSVRVRVNDRGPFYRSRDIDLSYGAAKKIGLTKKGVGRVKIEVISSPKEKGHYKKQHQKSK
ncbi:MAG: septal ring lytic transglycosylase RlpA family protein, partial [Epsilonproteobacteria bacterium]|nr:septal ring lytic transglycosylase RlpA family protein [Campylobacterota bacterium]